MAATWSHFKEISSTVTRSLKSFLRMAVRRPVCQGRACQVSSKKALFWQGTARRKQQETDETKTQKCPPNSISTRRARALEKAAADSEQAEVVYHDFQSYQRAMLQYQNDYRQYLKDYHEWRVKYGDAYDARRQFRAKR